MWLFASMDIKLSAYCLPMYALLPFPLEIYVGKEAFPSSERQSCCSASWVQFPAVFYSFLIYNIT